MSDPNRLLRETASPSTVGTLTYIMFGLLLWVLQLTVIYGGHVLVCSRSAPAELAGWIVYGATAVAALLLLGFVVWQSRAARLLGLTSAMADRRTYDRIALMIGALSGIAILWTGATAIVVTACEQAR
jgi:hypothetical protein